MDASAVVSAYALRFHEAVGEEHHVASPLGAWLLLALIAPEAGGSDRTAIERALGVSVEEARRAAEVLLADQPPAVHLALACWDKPGFDSTAIKRLRENLPAHVTTGPIPTNEVAAEWMRKTTNVQIGELPVAISEETLLLLVSVLATRVKWIRPFDVVPARLLGSGRWAADLGRVLHEGSYGGPWIAHTRAAGLVGLHAGGSTDGLLVVSAIAEPTVAPAAVIAAAHEVARSGCRMDGSATFPRLVDLPARGHAWNIGEGTSGHDVHDVNKWGESGEVLIPSWSAETSTDLLRNPAFGFTAAGRVFGEASGGVPSAMQSARARFDREGFEAATVTEYSTATFSVGSSPVRRLHATVRFSRPFAVVAVAQARATTASHAWHGLPVFSAWVTNPEKADVSGEDA